MHYFMGLDLSLTGAGCVVVDEDGKVVIDGVWGWDIPRDAPVRDKIERMVYIADKIIRAARSITEQEYNLAIGIENYAFWAKGAQNDLGEIQGAVKTQIWLALGLVPDIISPSSARKEVLGKGRFSKGTKGKKEIMAAVRERGFHTEDDNVADAYVIAECIRLRSKEM
jgi:hypothetical protein